MAHELTLLSKLLVFVAKLTCGTAMDSCWLCILYCIEVAVWADAADVAVVVDDVADVTGWDEVVVVWWNPF